MIQGFQGGVYRRQLFLVQGPQWWFLGHCILRFCGSPRLRIGVGTKPEGEDLSDWVLSPMPVEYEDVVVGLLPELTRAVELWLEEGVEAAMNRFNR